MHVTQGYLLTKDRRFDAKRHDERWTAIRQSPELNAAFRHAYAQLKDVSEQVRYDPGFDARPEDLSNSVRNLGRVEAIVKPKLDRALS